MQTTDLTNSFALTRRTFLETGTLFLAGLSVTSPLIAQEPSPAPQFGLLTDLHYADKPPAGTRYYRETLPKLQEAVETLSAERPTFVVELGDLIDAADDVETERSYLKTINQTFQALAEERHYVLGNHCVDTLTKAEFLEEVGQKSSYYSFDRAGFHFVILDACFRSDGQPYGRKNSHWTDANLPADELDWLAADLKAHPQPTIIFAHQRLDIAKNHSVKNAAAVRQILETHGQILAVFQGHSHQNDLQTIAGIPYCTIAAMIEGSGEAQNSYAMVSLFADRSLHLKGFHRQADRQWGAAEKPE